MEFGLVSCCWGCCHYCQDNPIYISLMFSFLGWPTGLLWIVRIIYRWNQPWFEGQGLARIEFPGPPIIPAVIYSEPLPVDLMVGESSEAKRCAYCHEEFCSDSARCFCFHCGSAEHEECATLNPVCCVYGCGENLLPPSRINQ